VRGSVRVLVVAALAATVCAGIVPAQAVPPRSATPAPSGPTPAILFSGEGNNLNAYDADRPFVKQNVIPARSRSPQGLDINAQICFFPDGSRRFIAGEDTGQPNPPPGWGIFKLKGNQVGKLSATEVAKLTPTYSGDDPNEGENFGCGFLSDGRVVTSDVGNQASGPATGQLII
jgi:hypothetical protein